MEEKGIRWATMQNPTNFKEHKEAHLQPFFFCDLCIITGSSGKITPELWELNAGCSLRKTRAMRLLDKTPRAALRRSFLGAFQREQRVNCTTKTPMNGRSKFHVRLKGIARRACCQQPVLLPCIPPTWTNSGTNRRGSLKAKFCGERVTTFKLTL